MVADGVQLIHIRLPILVFHILAQVKIVDREIDKGVNFVFKVSTICEPFQVKNKNIWQHPQV